MRPAPPDIVDKMASARQVVAVRTTSEQRRPEARHRETEIHYYLVTGKPGRRRLTARHLARLIRGHWGIENRLHHVLDRTLREDAQKTRVGDGPSILSLIRKSAMALINSATKKSPRRKYLPETQAMLRARPKKLLAMLKGRGT